MEGQNKLEEGTMSFKNIEQGKDFHNKPLDSFNNNKLIEKKEDEKNTKPHDKPYHKKKSYFPHKSKSYQPNNKETSHSDKSHFGNLDIKQASKTAKEKLAEVLNKKANSVVSVSKEGENWEAMIEIIDEEYLPGKNLESMNDIIGLYDVKLSDKGELLSWNKKSSRKRGNTSV